MTDRVITSSSDDGTAATLGASRLIQTLVWSVVILVALAVGILVLVHYNIL